MSTSKQVVKMILFYSSPGFSFEAGGRTFRPVVCHSTSGTLRSILAIFFYYGAREAPYGAKKTFTSGAFRSMSATLQNS